MSSPRHRFAASRIAPAQTVEDFVGVQIDPERRRGRGAGINPMGNALFAGLAMTLVIPIATLALVHRKLPPPSPTSGIAAVFD